MLNKYAPYISYIKRLRDLARERHRNYNTDAVLLSDMNSVGTILRKGLHDPVRDYLSDLDFDTVKVAEMIMYIGRDYREAEFDAVQPVANGDALINSFTQDIKGNSGWNEKRIEENQIGSKMPLDDYLTRGLKILGAE